LFAIFGGLVRSNRISPAKMKKTHLCNALFGEVVPKNEKKQLPKALPGQNSIDTPPKN